LIDPEHHSLFEPEDDSWLWESEPDTIIDGLLCDSVISPANHVIQFGGDDRLIEAVYDHKELRRLVPHVDDMLGDILATWRNREEADRLGEDCPEWEDDGDWEACEYAKLARDCLIDAGCIFAEFDLYEDIIYFTGRPDVLRRSFDLCIALAADSQAVLNIVAHSRGEFWGHP
jgi:hypothetical protein